MRSCSYAFDLEILSFYADVEECFFPCHNILWVKLKPVVQWRKSFTGASTAGHSVSTTTYTIQVCIAQQQYNDPKTQHMRNQTI